MFKTLAGLALVSAVLAAPGLAQERETEFGADVAIKWTKASGGGNALLSVQTPVDLRVAFHTAGRFAIEPRITALFLSSGGDNMHAFDIGLNALFGLPGSSHHAGVYATVGGDLDVTGGTGSSSLSIYSLNAGLGVRHRMGKNATRAEFLVGYTPKQGTSVTDNVITIGARLGFSFFT